MDADYIHTIVDRLRRWNYVVDLGLSDSEVSAIESSFGFRCPPDLRYFLQQALPVSGGWVDWGNGTEAEIRERLNWPLDGIIFDIE